MVDLINEDLINSHTVLGINNNVKYKCKECNVELEEFGTQKHGIQFKCPVCGLYSSIDAIFDKIILGYVEEVK